MNVKVLSTVFLLVGGLVLAAAVEADAARFGGGRSFGSKPSMQRSTTAPIQQKPSALAPAAPTAVQKPGLFGGMGGMLGGLLAGSLIGSLLFGGAFQGGGFMDMLLIALLLYMAFKLFARFRASRTATAEGPGGMSYRNDGPMQREAQSSWGTLRQSAAPAGPSVPPGFDVEEFLSGAKMAFTRLQASWDKRDLEDIAQFAGEAVMREVRTQFESDPAPGRTDVLLVNAQLLGVAEEEGQQKATVFFDALLREAPEMDAGQTREVWHFTRPVAGGSWKLDGIQQVE